MTTQRYLHPDVHKITAAGTALSVHLSVLRAPRSLPSPILMTADAGHEGWFPAGPQDPRPGDEDRSGISGHCRVERAD